MSGTNYLSLRADASFNTTSATVGSMGFSTLVGSTLSANTAVLMSTLSVSSLTTGSVGFSTLVGSTMTHHTMTVQSTITASTLTASGNVGIGSTLPVQKLDVNGSASLSGSFYMADAQNIFIGANTSNAIRLHHITNQSYLDYGSADLNIRSNDGSNVVNDRIMVKQNGNVGIGTTNPNEKLHVNGNLTLGVAGAQAGYYFYPRPTYSGDVAQANQSGGTLYGNTLDISSGYFQTAAWNGQFFSGVLNLRTGTQNDVGNNGTAGGTYQSGTVYLYTGDVVVRNDGGNAQTCIPGSIYFGTGKVVRNATGADPGPNPTWRMVINGSTGNVGIGTDNPTTSLHVVTSTTATTSGILSTRYYLRSPGDNQDTTGADQDGPWYGLGWSGIPGLSGDPYVCLAGFAGVAMRSGLGFLQLTSAGNVGIGATNPSTKLWIVPGISSTTLQGTAQWGGLHFQPNGTNNTINGITFGANGGFETQVEAGIICQTSDQYGTKLYFQTTNDYAAGAKNQMIIDNVGNVGIGTMAPANKLHIHTSSTHFKMTHTDNINSEAILQVDSVGNLVILPIQQGAAARNVLPQLDNSIGLGAAFNRWSAVFAAVGTINTSDGKLKEARPLPYGLNEILQVRTILYKWKTQADLPDDHPEKNFEYYGFCADELDPLFPELVYDEEKGAPVQMNYSEMLPVVVNAIKDLSSKVDGLTARNQTLEAENVAIQNHLVSLIRWAKTHGYVPS